MLEQVRQIIDKLKKHYVGSAFGYNALQALDAVLEDVDAIDMTQGVSINEHKIELCHPHTGETLVLYFRPSTDMIRLAHDMRDFYAKGPDSLK